MPHSKRQKFFLSRPRRFGKSLLLSTFESLFKYGLRDFHCLEIEALWKDESTYQVIRLDFSNLKGFSSAEEFSELLDQYLLDTLTVNRLVSPIKTDKEGQKETLETLWRFQAVGWSNKIFLHDRNCKVQTNQHFFRTQSLYRHFFNV